MDAIEQAIARAAAKAGPAMATNFVHADLVMSPAEFRAFWGESRLCAVGTVGKSSWPHAAPTDVQLNGDVFVVPSFSNAVRISDLRTNARLSLTTWDDGNHAAIVYGTSSFDEGSAETMIRIKIHPARIYAIRAPAGHAASRIFAPA